MTTNRKYPSELLSDSLHEILSAIETIDFKIEDRAELNRTKPIQGVYIDIILRIASHLNLLYIVFKNINEDSALKWLEHSIGICMRSSLLDCIVINEIIHDIDVRNGWNDPNIHNEVYLIHSSGQLKNILKTLDDIKSGKALFNAQIDVENLRRDLQKQFPDFFDVSGQLKYNFQGSTKTATIKTRTSAFFEEDASELFGLWDYYSKYEHYGPYSSVLLNFSGEKNWNRIVWSIMHVVKTLSIIFSGVDIPRAKLASKDLEVLAHNLYQLKVKE